jgi:hypothetical protein
MSATVLARLSGGLGNQMFQYAAARALADRHDADVVLDTRAFRAAALHAYTPRAYALAPFAVRARLGAADDLKPWPEWAAAAGSRIRTARPLLRRWHFERHITFDPAVPKLRPPVCLVGYWQSERYFSDRADAIRRDFQLREPLSGSNAEVLAVCRSAGSIGVHVRRGDFVSLATAARTHGTCSPDYYRRAITQLENESPGGRFVVFSDDAAWARAELPLAASTVFVNGNEQRPEIDMALMSACSHHIIANSSFSWWAAWLGQHAAQIVIAPTPWYADEKLDGRDLAVSGWRYIARV